MKNFIPLISSFLKAHQSFFTPFFLLIIAAIFAGCSCGQCSNDKVIEGKIAIVGNEPFTQVALFTDEEESFILICDDEIEKELRGNQGYVYKVAYTGMKKTSEGEGLIVVKVEKITKK